MCKEIFRILSSLLIAAAICGNAAAQPSQETPANTSQQNQNAAPAKSNEPPKAPAPEYVDFSGFKGKIIEVKHRSPYDLISIISPLASGFRGARLVANRQPPSISVRDFPENIATIEEAIKRLDVPLPPKPPEPATPPAPPSPDVEVYGYVLIAAQTEEGGSNYPKTIEDVIKQLQATLAFKSYRLFTTIAQRTRMDGSVVNSGLAALADNSVVGQYDFTINRISPRDYKDGVMVLPLSLNGISLRLNNLSGTGGQNFGSARINTDVRIRDGEKVVVGTASLKDKALILVLTAKVLK